LNDVSGRVWKWNIQRTADDIAGNRNDTRMNTGISVAVRINQI